MLFPFELEFVSAASSFADGVVKLPLLFLWKVVCPAGTGLVVACTNGFVAGGHPYPLRSRSLVDSPANPGHPLTWDTCPCKRVTDPASVMLLLVPPNLAQTHFKCWKTLLTINTPTRKKTSQTALFSNFVEAVFLKVCLLFYRWCSLKGIRRVIDWLPWRVRH